MERYKMRNGKKYSFSNDYDGNRYSFLTELKHVQKRISIPIFILLFILSLKISFSYATPLTISFEDVAKKAGIYRDNEEYGPRRIVVGKDEIIKGVEEALIGMKEGEANTVTIPPEKAYGSYDAGGIRFLQKSTFEGLSENVKPGDTISIKTASSIVPARVLNTTEQGLIIDLNHPLAGKPVVFAIILRKIESTPNASTPNAGPT